MSCIDCNWYCKDRRICIRTNQFEFESMPICDDFKEDINKIFLVLYCMTWYNKTNTD